MKKWFLNIKLATSLDRNDYVFSIIQRINARARKTLTCAAKIWVKK